jgi:hypothetical protein
MWVKGGRPARKAEGITAICELIVQELREPQRLVHLRASKTRYKDAG